MALIEPITAIHTSARASMITIHGRRRPKRLVVRSDSAPPIGIMISCSRAAAETAMLSDASLVSGAMEAIRSDSAVLRVSIMMYMPAAAISTRAIVLR
jgi:hypothetical protein